MDIVAYERALDRQTQRLSRLRFSEPVAHVYNPLRYARQLHVAYCRLATQSKIKVLLLGMNPGPWGMAQTGVPFGEVASVREWLRLDEPVDKPQREHPKRPIDGLNCTRSEVSGARLWGWAGARYQTPRKFFRTFFIANYCPLSFMQAGGRNVTPDKLPSAERDALFKHCDEMLHWLVEALSPRYLIGVGAFAEKRLFANFDGDDRFQIGRILHPSPASPAANRDWAGTVDQQLSKMGIAVPAPSGLATS